MISVIQIIKISLSLFHHNIMFSWLCHLTSCINFMSYSSWSNPFVICAVILRFSCNSALRTLGFSNYSYLSTYSSERIFSGCSHFCFFSSSFAFPIPTLSLYLKNMPPDSSALGRLEFWLSTSQQTNPICFLSSTQQIFQKSITFCYSE